VQLLAALTAESIMRVSTWLGLTLAATAGVWGVASQRSQAIQLADGTVYFAQPPRLVEAATTQNSLRVWGATYYFTISLPANASEPLQQVTFNQKQGVDTLRYNLEETRAFEGTRRNRGTELKLAAGMLDQDPQTVVVNFNPPVTPGKTVTIGLRPVYNPNVSGVYLFGVTAFPAGEKTHGQFLGFGRLQFYDLR
jgi:hypothetical protein